LVLRHEPDSCEGGPTVLIQLEPLIDQERFDALQTALARRAYGE
jgi:hypothetical protein